MQKIKLTLFAACILFTTGLSYADDGSNNPAYQACFNACTPDTPCNRLNNGNTNTRTQTFGARVACSNKQLNCEFACKDKYNVE